MKVVSTEEAIKNVAKGKTLAARGKLAKEAYRIAFQRIEQTEEVARRALEAQQSSERCYAALSEAYARNAAEILAPIPMLLWCPACGERHVDEGEFASKVHHTHACQDCGVVWRPAVVATVGVNFLPGFKNEVTK